MTWSAHDHVERSDADAVIARGREAAILDAGPGLVLRRYDDGRDTSVEVALHRYVAEQGFPVPRLVRPERGGMVLERIEGPTLLQAVLADTVSSTDAAEMLARLHRRLHALPPPPGSPPGTCVVHLDLHPANVLLGPAGPVVVDWASAGTGHRDLDTGHTAMVLAEVAVGLDPADAPAGASGPRLRQIALDLLDAFVSASPDGSPEARLHDVVGHRIRDGFSPDLAGAAATLVRDRVDAHRHAARSRVTGDDDRAPTPTTTWSTAPRHGGRHT